ncbi:MAG: hypothetical protein H6816_11465 [Phycisphaerales bacterium]|nr:hypothetical protein [Phycisphaerales bacterium]
MGHGIAIRHDLILDEGNKWRRGRLRHRRAGDQHGATDHLTARLRTSATIRRAIKGDFKAQKIAVKPAYAP